ncbi:GNAT acetyltransferase 2-domain-containing protein [Schizophyllum amplum]|uniref:RNA cytidine acetyltransferase n=1 Tax=Schizophyllum amplum TaxID=97359 RepID=A0A550CFR8_9AGAR|nr:GNAT acetyltransferase 2-domain-containing protein [Auriculariopsis ampla]
MRKQLDPRIPILINNNVKKNHRSFIVLVGDKGRDQIVNLHFLLSQARVSARPSVLWCYKKELGFTSHRKKREAKIKRDVKSGRREPNEQNPFEIFVTVTDIRYTYYKESHKILGNTYGMCVLQDFEAITPNLLARTIETVEGGGLVVLLLKTMSSLRQLYNMTMDVHARYRTASHDAVSPRFNERFILSLGSCDDCLFLDDELNVLPISRGKDIAPVEANELPKPQTSELKELAESLADTKPADALVPLARTVDQAQAILTFIDAISSKTLSSTVSLTASRGRGKSAALGLSIAAALSFGYSNIFVTSPTPENLKTLFEFIFKGMDALGYEEHLDYDIMQSTNPDWGKAIVRVNVFKGHRQTIQYIQPEDAHVLGQAELVIIDEAAAIPLPLVRNLIGPYLVFLASTINGYEGTGRSLSLKLIQQLRESTRSTPSGPPNTVSKDDAAPAPTKKKAAAAPAPVKTRSLREVKLTTPIRYGTGDKIERWLNQLLCLDCTSSAPSAAAQAQGTPHPSTCPLFRVSRDTLFSYHPASELFLQRMMSLYVSSHYKNQPNDLQLLSDAPAHELFVLLPPIKDDERYLPEPIVVIQVALEGGVRRGVGQEELRRGAVAGEGGEGDDRNWRSGGDLIPWIVSSQFQEAGFGRRLSGARIVRIAVSPDYASMGYGSRALQALSQFYSGELYDYTKASGPDDSAMQEDGGIAPSTSLLTESAPTVRNVSSMPPLLQRLEEVKPHTLDWLGVSYGLTGQLLRFWKRAGYVPIYIRQTTSDLTGEHTCVMIKSLSTADNGGDWVVEFAKDFRRRFLSLLSFPRFRDWTSVTSLSVLEAVESGVKKGGQTLSGDVLTAGDLAHHLTPYDVKRLESYANNMLDFHVIMDMMPTIASMYFAGKFGANDNGDGDAVEKAVKLSAAQSAILLALGLQRKTIEDVERELQLPVSQSLALFNKVIRKICKRISDVRKEGIVATATDLPSETARITLVPGEVVREMEEELDEAGDEERARRREMISSLDLKKFAITQEAIEGAEIGARGIVSVKVAKDVGHKRKADVEDAPQQKDKAKRRPSKKAKQ